MGNAIHDLLDSIALPWRSSMAELVERYGIRCDGPFRTDVVSIPTRPPLLGGMLRPLEAAVGRGFASHLPSLEFSCEASQGPDAGFNIRFAADELRTALGPAEIRKRGNILRCDWTAGRAALALVVWPLDWQRPHVNPAHGRDPRLATACRVDVTTGFRLSPTQEELTQIADYETFARIDIGGPAMSRQHELEFLRDIDCPSTMRKTIGWSQDRRALIFCDDELHILAIEDVVRFEVDRVLPAKGSGCAMLSVVCRSRSGETDKRLVLTSAPGPDDLDELGARLGRALGKPCELLPYQYDT